MQCIRTFVEASDAMVFRTVPIVCNALEHLWRLLMLWFLGLYLLYAMHWNICGGFFVDAMVFRTVPIVCNALEHLGRLLMLRFFRTVPIVCNALEHLWRLLMLRFLGLYLLYAMH